MIIFWVAAMPSPKNDREHPIFASGAGIARATRGECAHFAGALRPQNERFK
jgi:hypothetical protein